MERKYGKDFNVTVICLCYSWDQIFWLLICAILIKLAANLIAVGNIWRNSSKATMKSCSTFNVMLPNLTQIITTKLRESQHSTRLCYAWKCCKILLPRKNWFALFATLNFRNHYRTQNQAQYIQCKFVSLCINFIIIT